MNTNQAQPTYTDNELEVLEVLATKKDDELGFKLTPNELRTFFKVLLVGKSKLKVSELREYLINKRNEYSEYKKQKFQLVKEQYETSELDVNYVAKAYLNNVSAKDFTDTIFESWLKEFNISTIAKGKKKQILGLLENLANTYQDSNEWCSEVLILINQKIKPLNKELNSQYGKDVNDMGKDENLLHLDGNKIIDWCIKVLTEFTDTKFTTKTKRWFEPSLALALTSGRRMIEIHGDNCKFSKGSDSFKVNKFSKVTTNNLIAIGLAKKEGDDFKIESPCLVDVDLWLKAYNKMCLEYTCMNKTDKQVNQTISKTLSEQLDKSYDELGFKDFDDNKFKQYKTSRDFYIAYCCKYLYDGDPTQAIDYANALVGHSSVKVSLSYRKISFS